MAGGRRRLGVALLVEPPEGHQIDGLRRALGDPSLERIGPHLTLVPPVNVKTADIPAALGRVRAAAARASGALVLTLGAAETFLPHNPVLYLAVGGDLDGLRSLRDGIWGPPLERPLTWPWVPHVTLADGVPPERIDPALIALAGYSARVAIERVVVLEERAGRRWVPWADARLGPAVRIGTGGLALDFTSGRLPDPEALEALGLELPESLGGSFDQIVVTARREGEPAGTAVAWLDRAGGHVAVFVAAEHRRQGVGSHLLARIESEARDREWSPPTLAAEGPAAFYTGRSRWARPPD